MAGLDPQPARVPLPASQKCVQPPERVNSKASHPARSQDLAHLSHVDPDSSDMVNRSCTTSSSADSALRQHPEPTSTQGTAVVPLATTCPTSTRAGPLLSVGCSMVRITNDPEGSGERGPASPRLARSATKNKKRKVWFLYFFFWQRCGRTLYHGT